MCIAFSIENERPVHTHDNLSPDHQRRQYCAILRNIVRQNWACTAFVHMQFNVCTVRPTYILAIEKDISIASTAQILR